MKNNIKNYSIATLELVEEIRNMSNENLLDYVNDLITKQKQAIVISSILKHDLNDNFMERLDCLNIIKNSLECLLTEPK